MTQYIDISNIMTLNIYFTVIEIKWHGVIYSYMNGNSDNGYKGK